MNLNNPCFPTLSLGTGFGKPRLELLYLYNFTQIQKNNTTLFASKFKSQNSLNILIFLASNLIQGCVKDIPKVLLLYMKDGNVQECLVLGRIDLHLTFDVICVIRH